MNAQVDTSPIASGLKRYSTRPGREPLSFPNGVTNPVRSRAFRNTFRARPGERSFSGAAPDYLRFLRGKVKKSGVLVLDHSPALELLVDAGGTVSGATGYQRQVKRPWRVDAGAVILATGGTTWKSHSLGGDVNTGDGHLMAAEVGAHLSSMEFSNFYGMVPFGTSMDKNGFFVTASYWDHLGEPIHYHDLHQSRAELLGASLRGTITAQFTQFGEEVQPALRAPCPISSWSRTSWGSIRSTNASRWTGFKKERSEHRWDTYPRP